MKTTAEWKRNLLNHAAVSWHLQDDMLMSSIPLLPEPGYDNIDYQSILTDPYRTITAEHPFYVKAIYQALTKTASDSDLLVADFGCGDGRFTKLLIDKGVQRVVAMDSSCENLKRLRSRLWLDTTVRDKVLLVEGDIANPPIQGRNFDLIIAVGVLLILNHAYAEGVKACASRLKPGGYLLTIDPTDFGAAMYAIVRNDLEELAKVVWEGTKTVDINQPDAVRYSVRNVGEMIEAHRQAGQSVVDTMGIPLFPSLIFGGLKQNAGIDPKDWPRLKALNDRLVEMHPDVWRAACVLSQCPER